MAGRIAGPKLNPGILIEIDKLFTTKNWSKTTLATNKSHYQRYCERISIFNENEQLFFLELSKKFHQVLLKDYVASIWKAYGKVPKDLLKGSDKIYIAPLLEILPNGEKKSKETKSSSALIYILKGDSFDWVDYSERFVFCDNIVDVKKDFTEKSLLILVDDFIGSGKTAVDAFNSHKNFIPLLNEKNAIILSIVSQKGGMQKIKDEIKSLIESHLLFERGISDYYKGEILQIKLKLMQSMEDKISPSIKKNGYNLGFMQCEALVSFANRPPNNTLPSFWYETSNKMAPFPRYRNYNGSDL